jgi:hypothetical protein
MTGMKQRTASFRADVFFKCSKMFQYGMVPDGIKIIHKDISQFEFRKLKKQVTRIHIAVRQKRQLGGAGRTPDPFKFRVTGQIREEAGTKHPVNVSDAFF